MVADTEEVIVNGSTGSSRVEKYKQPGRFQDTKHKVDFPTRSLT